MEKVKKRIRSISILTVFLWFSLIAVMTFITISGMREKNAIMKAQPDVIFKVKVEGISEEEIAERYETTRFGISSDGNYNSYEYSNKENEYYVYTLNGEDEVFNADYSNIITIYEPPALKRIEGYFPYTEYKIGDKNYTTDTSDLYINDFYLDDSIISENNEIIVYVTHKYIKNDNQGITKSSKWINKDQGVAQIKLQYLPVVSETKYKTIAGMMKYNKEILYVDKLSQDFELSSEYVTNDEWSILESVSDSGEEIYNELYDENTGVPTGKKYIYVKSTNTIYWYIDKNEFSTASNIDTFTFNVVYKEIDNEKIIDEMLDTNELAASTLNTGESIIISSPKLEYIRKREAIIKINKEVIGEKGNKTYYVGLFTDDTSDKTDKITKIDAVNGKGVATIEIAEYNLEDKYYVYEVDENGNKISDEKLNYSRNNVMFEKANSLSIREITSNKEIVSEYISTDMTGVDLGRGTGEENYIDNVLSIRDVYEDSITISSEKIKYNVTYKAEDGGTIEGEIEEQVYPGYYPENVPTPKPNEGYDFIRWEVEVNGERIEVIPSEYEINKDTVFYAIFEKIPVEESVDTSDINVGAYVVVLVVAIVGIASVVFFTLKNKKKSIK